MTIFQDFANKATSGDAKGAVKLWTDSSRAILSEYRRIRDAEEGDEWHSGGYDLFDKLISGVEAGDFQSKQTFIELIDAGVMLNETDWSGYTPVGLLAMHGELELLKAAIAKGGDINAGETNALAMMFGMKELNPNWIEQANFLIGAGVDVNGRVDQHPAMFFAIGRNHREVIRYLARKGADINRPFDSENKSRCGTAMHYSLIAALSRHTDLETGKLLVELGGDPTVKNKDGLGAIDAFFASDREPSENVKALTELYSSTDAWRRASWHLTAVPPSSYNPPRRKNARAQSEERVWQEIPGIRVAFRIGDKVEVIRRAGLFGNLVSLTLLESSGERECDRDMRAMPGTTGTIVAWRNENEYLGYHWKALIEFDPGTWEEANNYGHLRSIGRCRGELFADCLKITQTAEESSGASMKVSAGPRGSSSDAEPSIPEHLKNWKVWAIIVAILVLILVLR